MSGRAGSVLDNVTKFRHIVQDRPGTSRHNLHPSTPQPVALTRVSLTLPFVANTREWVYCDS